MATVTVFDVAHRILTKLPSISAMKLQKLVYYAQAWHLAWEDAPLFEEKVEAWANGPVVPALFKIHRGQFQVKLEQLKSHRTSVKFSDSQKETIDKVCQFYGKQTPQWLSDQTHSEEPWQKAREGLSDAKRGNEEITIEAMQAYYSNLP